MVAGSSYTFDGNGDYLTYGDLSFMDGLTSFTVSIWAKRPAFPNGGLMGKWTGSAANTFYLYVDGSDKLTTSISDPLGNVLNEKTDDIKTFTTTGEWFHIAWVWNGGNVEEVYVDGVGRITSTSAASNPTSWGGGTAPWVLGAIRTTSNFGNLDIAYLRIFDYAFNEDERKEIQYKPYSLTKGLVFSTDLTDEDATDHVNGSTATVGGDASLSTDGPPVFF